MPKDQDRHLHSSRQHTRGHTPSSVSNIFTIADDQNNDSFVRELQEEFESRYNRNKKRSSTRKSFLSVTSFKSAGVTSVGGNEGMMLKRRLDKLKAERQMKESKLEGF